MPSVKYYLSRCIVSGVLWGSGDVLAQVVARHRSVIKQWQAGEKISSHNHPKITAASIDWGRTQQIAGFAFFVFAPMATQWYSWLYSMLPRTTVPSLTARVLLDQLLWSPVILSIFFSATAVMKEGITSQGVEEAQYRVKHVVPNTLLVNWAVWFPVQALNFYFVPRHRWIYVVNAVSVPWTGYLAHRNADLSA